MWLIEEVNYQNDNNVAQRLCYLLEEMKQPVKTFKYIPFGGTDYSFLPTEPPLIFFGTCNVVQDIRARNIPVPDPFVWCDWELFSCHVYYEKLKPYILQADYRFMSLGELDETVFTEDKIFIRPDDNQKTFVGEAVKFDLFKPWKRDLLGYRQCSEKLNVVVAKIQSIEEEWRTIIVNDKAVTGSRYKKHGMLDIDENCPNEVLIFAEKVASCWSPHPVFVVDVGLVNDEFKVVEIGPFNYAGLYGCDLRKIVTAISNYLELR